MWTCFKHQSSSGVYFCVGEDRRGSNALLTMEWVGVLEIIRKLEV